MCSALKADSARESMKTAAPSSYAFLASASEIRGAVSPGAGVAAGAALAVATFAFFSGLAHAITNAKIGIANKSKIFRINLSF